MYTLYREDQKSLYYSVVGLYNTSCYQNKKLREATVLPYRCHYRAIHKWALLSEHVHLLSFVGLGICAVQYSIHRTVRHPPRNLMSEIYTENITTYNHNIPSHPPPPPPIPRNANSEQNFSAKQNTERRKQIICSDKMSNSDVAYEIIPF